MVPLEAKIEAKRHLLNTVAAVKGPLHEDVLVLSQELDKFIYECMLQKSKTETMKHNMYAEAI